jgi:hypothetical protein
MSYWRVEEIPELKGFVIEWAEAGNYILSRRNQFFHTPDISQKPKLIGEFESPFWRELIAASRLGQRLLRFSANCVIPVSTGEFFVSFDRSIGILRDGKFIRINGLRRPCRILRSGVAIHPSGDLYFGEYTANTEREPVFIYRYKPGTDEVSIAYEFPAGSIRHIHGIYFDKFDDSLICLTGDADDECRMISTHDGFNSIDIIGEGDESWRAVSVLFTEDAYFYGTDAEFRPNTIYRLDRKTREQRALGEVSGTVFYSQQIEDELFFATTAENAPSQDENVAAIWNVSPTGQLSEIVKFQKDRWHKTLFGFGTIYFPHISSPGTELFFSISALMGDRKTYRIVPNN